MLFSQLNIGDKVYIIEVVGTFKKTTEYNEGTVTQVSAIYDEPIQPNQFPIPSQRRKVVDITIQCNGESKKFTIPENKSIITDNTIGLTISTDRMEIANVVKSQYDMYRQRKEAMTKCDEEMDRCRAILDKLNITPTLDNHSEIDQLKADIADLKSVLTDLKADRTE